MVAVVALLAIACFLLCDDAHGQEAVDLGDFWNNDAHFQYVSKARFPSPPPSTQYAMNVGFQFVTRPGIWYLFHSEYAFTTQPSYCKADYARILVRNSTDEGRTWSAGTVVATPIPNTAQECAIVDGAGFYDDETNTWHYIAQCLNRTDHWMLCHYTRQGETPTGMFTPNPYNPVVYGGQLWSRICALPHAHCDENMYDEGTPEIFTKVEGNFYVTFHGWDAKAGKSARGIAMTPNFVDWSVTGAGLPGDAIFTSKDCEHWNVTWAKGGCVGGGEGTMLAASDIFYHLIEAPDITLGCLTKPGLQNWVLGMLRAPGIEATGMWQQSFNPIVVPAVKQGCYIQYHRLFKGDNATYLEYWAADWMQVFKLVPGPGPRPIVAGPPPDI